ncbi:hypothetical protein T484DRAFT_1866427 [Baffinella frigidus]|nr:hypothetical protein T484DRAFT_1866427 [Cryptophyta sp. CCMP2293]
MDLARLTIAFEVKEYEVGETLVMEGKPAAEMFVIQSGTAFMIETIDGLESVMATLSPGDMFGADTLFGHNLPAL